MKMRCLIIFTVNYHALFLLNRFIEDILFYFLIVYYHNYTPTTLTFDVLYSHNLLWPSITGRMFIGTN